MKDYGVDHSAYHAFQREFDCDTVQDDIELEKYLEAHPEVITTSCDDDHHCSATIMLFPHIHMGASVVFAPQCTTARGRFFLYPGHIDGLIKALQEARKAIGANLHDDMHVLVQQYREGLK